MTESRSSEPELRTGKDWTELLEPNMQVVDDDGWRRDDGVRFDTTPITKEDFWERYGRSTIMRR